MLQDVEEIVQEYQSDALPAREQTSLQVELFIPVLPPSIDGLSKLISIRYEVQVGRCVGGGEIRSPVVETKEKRKRKKIKIHQ